MKILLLILIAYLLGSIQTGLWIGKVFFHTNLREHGSGNTGTTNTFRVLGKTAGTITFSSYLAKMSAEYIPKCMKSIRGKLKQQKMVAGFVVSPTIYLFLAKSRHDPDFFF